ncbi:MAG TPA: TRAP transporter small permease [Spirochaetia bacterium]|nr:TRAP transporter small permease [Spirochaetia bacterium]
MVAETTPDGAGKGGSFQRVYGRVKKINELFVNTLMVCMVGLVFANVISRYFLNFSIAWSSEIARYIFIWLVFLGSILAFQSGEHLGFDLLPKVFRPKIGRSLTVITDLLVLLAIYILLVGGWQYSIGSLNGGWNSPAAGIPLGIVQIMLPICSVMLFAEGIGKLVTDIRSLVAAFHTPEGVD